MNSLALGNTMSVNVLERILVRALPAAKLVPQGRLVDRWENGSAIATLEKTKGTRFSVGGEPTLVVLSLGDLPPPRSDTAPTWFVGFVSALVFHILSWSRPVFFCWF
jgi:hypothetical protein